MLSGSSSTAWWMVLKSLLSVSSDAQSDHIGRMKKHYEKCVKQPRSSEPQPSTASEPQQDTVYDPVPVLVS